MRPAPGALRLAAAAAALVAGASPPPARAACGTGNDWAILQFNGQGTNASPSNNVDNLIFFASDTYLFAKSPEGFDRGFINAGGTIENAPVAVPLQDGSWAVFVVAQDGWLYEGRINGFGFLSSYDARDFRRVACAGDMLEATPAVQIKAFSGAGYTRGEDIVMVVTRHGCGDTTGNQIVAVDAADIHQTLWTFNANGEVPMDFGSQGCFVDYDRDVVYCGTNRPDGAAQPTVWALHTVDGSLAWSADVGPLRNRPQLGYPFTGGSFQHLYAAARDGVLHALAPDTGDERWSLPIAAPSTFVENDVWAEFRDPWGGEIFLADGDGVLHVVADRDDHGEIVWEQDFASLGVHMKGLGSLSPDAGKMWVGMDDGTVRQLDLATGDIEASRCVAQAFAPCTSVPGHIATDPTLYVSATGIDIDELVVSAQDASGAGTVTKQFCVPFDVGLTGY